MTGWCDARFRHWRLLGYPLGFGQRVVVAMNDRLGSRIVPSQLINFLLNSTGTEIKMIGFY
jgi:hypothetical protein